VTSTTLTGTQKAAVLLVQLGRERAAKVLATMGESEVEEVTAEIVRMGQIAPELAARVVEEFHGLATSGQPVAATGGLDFARQLLETSLGAQRASGVLGRVAASTATGPFDFLHEADPRQMLSFIAGEHPQTIALVVAHLSPEQASAVVSGLEPEVQSDVAHRIAVMERTAPDAVNAVAEILQRKTSSVLAPTGATTVGGVQPLVEIINRADPGTEKLILEGLEKRDRDLAEEVRSRLFVFDDVLTLEDRALQLVLRQVEAQDLATALKGARDEVKDKILGNVSERARENLVDEIEMLGPVRLSLVEEARSKVVQVIRSLEESGQITIRRDSEDAYVA
jgi:flagellar motor switch protein FliG